MKTIISIRVNENVRLALIEEGLRVSWRFCKPIDSLHSQIYKKGSEEEFELVKQITAEEKRKITNRIDRIDTAYELLVTGKALGGLNAINFKG